MKDQYVGDTNDFLKYALLRSLRHGDSRPITVVWMRTAHDGRPDGNRLSYLSSPAIHRSVDPPLFDALLALVRADQRNVAAVKTAGILRGARFIEDALFDDRILRAEYFKNALIHASGSSFIFFDPDNGLETQSTPRGRRHSSKYVFIDEIAAAFAGGASVIVYQHLPRRPRDPFLRSTAARLLEAVDCPSVDAVVSSHVAFLILSQARDCEALATRAEDLCRRASSLRAHFRRLMPAEPHALDSTGVSTSRPRAIPSEQNQK
jgi:hypothetical protein